MVPTGTIARRCGNTGGEGKLPAVAEVAVEAAIGVEGGHRGLDGPVGVGGADHEDFPVGLDQDGVGIVVAAEADRNSSAGAEGGVE